MTLFGLLLIGVLTQDPARVHIDLYERVAPAVVAVRQGQALRETDDTRIGSGVIVDPRGYVLTSARTVKDEREVTVFFQGGRAENASVSSRVPEKELVVLKLSSREKYPAVPLGASAEAGVGTVCYVLGDSFSSIVTDGQPAISVGILSARYAIKKRADHPYEGEVLETSAAVNPNQGGAPLVDARGRLLGLVTMNYHDTRFAGIAVPVDALKEPVEKALAGGGAAAPAGGWIGADFETADGQVRVARVQKEGPAEKGGLAAGDVVVGLRRGEVKLAVRTLAELTAALASVAPGEAATLRVYRGSESKERDVAVTAARKP